LAFNPLQFINNKMKFAHALKEALEKDGYPENWVAAAVPYGQLKKCLKKVSLRTARQLLLECRFLCSLQ
jgi:E3 ubiquitin-protein ligase BAH